VIAVNRVSGDERVHNAQKPAALIAELVTNATDKGDLVLDLFGGSGTTLIVCEDLSRRARLMETEPRECDKILARWERHTGRVAELLPNAA
jgi:DNA modification methylase